MHVRRKQDPCNHCIQNYSWLTVSKLGMKLLLPFRCRQECRKRCRGIVPAGCTSKRSHVCMVNVQCNREVE